MRIAYRRMSGAIGVSPLESGTRGMWWEKRIALIDWLKKRGHKVDFVNRMTKYSPQLTVPYEQQDVLMIEFGSKNQQFYGEDLRRTVELVHSHRGTIVYLCDDPDLPYLWNTMSDEQMNRTMVWSNCLKPELDSTIPDIIVSRRDFPFSALQAKRSPAMSYGNSLVYIGRPKGREQVFDKILKAPVPLQIYGKQAEWGDFPVTVYDAPAQVKRADFYNASLGCLAIADKKHKKLGWRTGRAYHAALAGCPVAAESDHPGLSAFETFENPQQLLELAEKWMDPREREKTVERQLQAIADDIVTCEKRAKEIGL